MVNKDNSDPIVETLQTERGEVQEADGIELLDQEEDIDLFEDEEIDDNKLELPEIDFSYEDDEFIMLEVLYNAKKEKIMDKINNKACMRKLRIEIKKIMQKTNKLHRERKKLHHIYEKVKIDSIDDEIRRNNVKIQEILIQEIIL